MLSKENQIENAVSYRDTLTSFLSHDVYFPLLYHTLDLHVPLKWKTENPVLVNKNIYH